MCGYRSDLKQQHFRDGSVYHAPLEPKPGGAVSLPLANQGLVMKALDQSQPRWAGNCGDIFPFFISPKYLNRNRTDLVINPSMFFDPPHTIYNI
jgi:hypothetical protein